MAEINTRTLKLKLRVVSEDKDAVWRRLRQIAGQTWRAANWIASGQYLNDGLMRRLYARRKIDARDKEQVQGIEDQFQQVFGTKRQATTERDIKREFPDLPPCVTNTLNQVVVSSYKAEKPELLAGNRSLRSYRRGLPVPTAKRAIELADNGKTHRVSWKLGRNERIEFEVIYGRDRPNFRHTVQRILDGINDYGAPSVKVDGKDLYLLLPVKEPKEDKQLNMELTVGVDVGIVFPVYAAVSDGQRRARVGSKETFFDQRTQMSARRRRLQRELRAAYGGKGRKRKLKALDRLKEKERNFARTQNHDYARKVVDLALETGAGNINLEMLKGLVEDKRDSFILRYWSVRDLQTR